MKVEYATKQTIDGWAATFKIAHQTFTLQDVESEQRAQWYCDQLKPALEKLTGDNYKQFEKDGKIKVWELDFGDMNVISADAKDLSDWIFAEIYGEQDAVTEWEYTIKSYYLTAEEIADLPEWN